MPLVATGPQIDPGVEGVNLTFDYGPELSLSPYAPNVTIVRAYGPGGVGQPIGCSVVSGGVDPSPSSRVIGSPAIVPSPDTKQPSAAVVQKIGNLLAGLVYQFWCIVDTSDGQSLSIRRNIPVPVPPQ